MNERDPLTNASEYIKINKQYTVIPESEPIGLLQISKRAGFKRQKERNRQVIKRKEYLSQLKSLLEEVAISTFFRNQLLHEADLGWAEEYTDPSAIDSSALDLLGISLQKGQAGIFEPKNSLFLELNYFYKIAPLLRYREKHNFPTPVSWKEWEVYLDRRRKG